MVAWVASDLTRVKNVKFDYQAQLTQAKLGAVVQSWKAGRRPLVPPGAGEEAPEQRKFLSKLKYGKE